MTPMSSHCQSISESFIEDTLNDNDAAYDLTSFCDGASQDVENQTGKSQRTVQV
jgi:hypothetical protein